MPISVNMFGERLTIDLQPRTSSGQPAHSTAGVARASCSQTTHGAPRAAWSAGAISPIATASSGSARPAASQNRRVMSASSGFATSSSATARGSSAMPQTGQSTGAGRTTSRCIGQTYSVRVAATGTSRSSAMPQTGHAPGWLSRTSGSIGHTHAGPLGREAGAGAAATGVGAAPIVGSIGLCAIGIVGIAGIAGLRIPCVPGAARIAAGSASNRSAQRGPQK